jgi:cytochrome c oxidase assembly protein subunit 15
MDAMTRYNPGVHRFAVFVVVWTVLLLVAGALVTSEQAALSVPDWPLSYGSLTPPMVGGVQFEHTHRVLAMILGIWTIILAALVWIKDRRPRLRALAAIALLAVVVQGILGGLTVLKLLQYWLPVMHACFAQLFLAAVLSIAIFTSRWWLSEHTPLEAGNGPSIHAVATVNACIIFLQVVLGAGFRHQDIPVWPHIVGAFVVFGSITWTALVMHSRYAQSREISKARIMLHAIFGLQFLLGFGALWTRISTAQAPSPVPVMVVFTVIHTVVGALLFALSIAVVLICYRLVPRRGELAPATQGQATV